MNVVAGLATCPARLTAGGDQTVGATRGCLEGEVSTLSLPPISLASSVKASEKWSQSWKRRGASWFERQSPHRSGARSSVSTILCSRSSTTKINPSSPCSSTPQLTCRRSILPLGFPTKKGHAASSPARNLPPSAAAATFKPMYKGFSSSHICSGRRKPMVHAKKIRDSHGLTLPLRSFQILRASLTPLKQSPAANTPRMGETSTSSQTTAMPTAKASIITTTTTS
mmetsp:Transcript_4267/g.8602  ORF Transcript_4267/g.8602 Transcript_4267/m.8602 type:complete len:226 (-) Transcript_4267:694-1371(-)